MPAKKGNNYAKGNKGGGRKTVYKAEYAELAYNYCLLGATDEQLGGFLKVSEQTINNWKKSHKDFSLAIARAKEQADAVVAMSLYHRANGYSHPDVDIKMYEGQIIKTELIKHYPPDTNAAMFWLKNRQPKIWRDKQEIEHSGSIINVEIK
jgi:hypothetical protein